ncbi:MAG: type IX secretion system sortase PorU [Saprospiraceae bacterium]
MIRKISPIAIVFLSCFFCFSAMHSQTSTTLSFDIPWTVKDSILKMDGGIYNEENPNYDIFHAMIPVNHQKLISARVISTKTEIIDIQTSKENKYKSDFELTSEIYEFRGKYFVQLYLHPIRKSANSLEKLNHFAVEFQFANDIFEAQANRNPEATYNSVLENGEFFKISVEKTGIYKIDKDFIESKIGKSISGIIPSKIKIYGQRGGMLPEANSSPRIDDLKELSIFVEGESDSKFDGSDYILFYAEGPERIEYDSISNNYKLNKNIYDKNNFYFITFEGKDGKRVVNQTNVPNPNITLDYYNDVQRYEVDETNLLGSYDRTEGAGKDWYGDYFKSERSKSYSSAFNTENFLPQSDMRISMKFAARSKSSSSIQLSIGSTVIKKSIQGVNITNIESSYASVAFIDQKIVLAEANPTIKLEFPQTSSDSEGWLDYIQLEGIKYLDLSPPQLSFRNNADVKSGTIGLSFANGSGKSIWNVTNPFQVQNMKVENNSISYGSNSVHQEFIAHNGASGAFIPGFVNKVPNQNIHSVNDEDMLIVYFPEVKSEAERLREHREKTSNIKVRSIEIGQVYNEFSSGRCDPTAIRDLAKLLLYRNPNFKYLLLFGDGSYDYKGIARDIKPENFIPVYETDNSLDPIIAFPSDDYYGLLGANEGVGLVGSVDLAIGRLTVRNIDEAKNVVDKIIHYETSPECLGDWRMKLVYCADDEDSNWHLVDMDDIAKKDANRHKKLNQNKIYFDSYEQVSTSGEHRYPDANRDINQNVFKGSLGFTYLGHGGPLGWAQERVLTIPDIQSWTNFNKLMLMTTATCSFGAYDDPAITSPAELALLNPKGGAIALLTTTRSVYTNSNKILTDAVHAQLFSKIDNQASTFGEALMIGKNKSSLSSFEVNSRKFALIGDPSVKIALPKLDVITSSINGKDPSTLRDTFHALDKISISGFIADNNGNVVNSFNGTVYPTVYDKLTTIKTLANDDDSYPLSFTMFKNIIFKGAAEVKDGKFEFSFYVPKNINYTIGSGRISYYASDGVSMDAGGYFDAFEVGGTSKNAIADDQGPQVKLFLNDESFVDGGITNSDPILIMDLKDDYGINVTGTAIGQDITATINNDNQNIQVLNDFYESEKGDYTSGRVTFPLKDIPAGKHQIYGKAWDISGNPGDAKLEFTVSKAGDDILKHVLNYPNPFNSNTQFTFEHDFSPSELDITVHIYTVSGKLVKSITQTKFYNGSRIHDINWNGKDDYENRLARGVYLYKIFAHSKELNVTKESKFEKLVIL